MSEPLILSGKDVSQSVYTSLLNRISLLKDQNITPGLAVVIVGEDPASQVYVRSKTKKFKQLNLYQVGQYFGYLYQILFMLYQK